MKNVAPNSSATKPKQPRYLADPLVLFCILLVSVGLGSFGYWLATAPLAQGITANGVLIVQDRRRTVQHREGGIIASVNIEEGQKVRAGDLAMTITDAESDARFARASIDRMNLLAKLDRYSAQINGDSSIQYTLLEEEKLAAEARDLIVSLNNSLFADERAAHDGERMLINARIDRLHSEINALKVRREGKLREIEALSKEQNIQFKAVSQRLGNVSRVNELARFMAIAETELADLHEQEHVINNSIAEAKLELSQIDLRLRAEVSNLRTEAFGHLKAVTEELRASSDRQNRSAVLTPVDGVVIDLAYSAEGGVVQPGEPLFDIVPSNASFQVEVRFQPKDRDDLIEGRDVNLRFGTLNPLNPPMITGRLETIAADASFDEQTSGFYYLSTITITELELAALDDFKISPGIPVEVFFDKGTPRTPLSYFIEPIVEMLRLGMRS